MSVTITGVSAHSPCAGKVKAGETLVSVNGHEIVDVLDYRFYTSEKKLSLEIKNTEGELRQVKLKKGEYDDAGLEFETYLMDKHHSCKNKCVFCFIDQLPKGMRESLYFKDDDSRLSFLFGNYITLTNLSEREAQRIIEMKISPVNVSVHTMNPLLRCEMMNNRFAGESLKLLDSFAAAGIKINTQLVLCPGVNDGAELEFSLNELAKLYPAVQSIAAVPVGLTKHREGLCNLRLFSKEESARVIDTVDSFNASFFERYGERIAFAADEFFLNCGRELPPEAYYGDYPQLDNGVGLWRLMYDEFLQALSEAEGKSFCGEVDAATGEAAFPLISELAAKAQEAFPKIKIHVHKIINNFFGESITVSGLLTGSDIILQLDGKLQSETLLIPSVTLRDGEPVFLDDVTLSDAEERLKTKIIPVANDGFELLEGFLKGGEK